VVLVLHEKVLVDAVSGESDSGSTQTGQGALEAVPAGKCASVSPGLTVSECVSFSLLDYSNRHDNIRALPGVVSGLAGGLFEGFHVEAGEVGLGPAGRSEYSVQSALAVVSIFTGARVDGISLARHDTLNCAMFVPRRKHCFQLSRLGPVVTELVGWREGVLLSVGGYSESAR
jgi:hypothetical protein